MECSRQHAGRHWNESDPARYCTCAGDAARELGIKIPHGTGNAVLLPRVMISI